MPRLTHPPIEQAAFEVIVELSANKTFADLKRVSDRLSGSYPSSTDLHKHQLEVTFGQEQTKSRVQDLGDFGKQLWSPDQKHGIQVRMDGILFSRNAPYPDWETCFMQFESALKIYFEEMSPRSVKRISSRFINRLELEIGAQIEDYIRIPIPTPSGVENPQVSQLASRVTFTEPGKSLVATVIQMSTPSPHSGYLNVILDIDVADTASTRADLEELKVRFGAIREYKNMLFETSITPTLLARYQ